ncbi:MAG TPA: hypothetical protein VKD67_10500 [Acidimicrobiales bacterium]|nr:hypothetical protein [Acidimicrobiales bacterium]
MTARRIGVILLLVTLVAAGWYFFAYLFWWEWNRALVAGVIMVAAEVALGTLFVMARLDELRRKVDVASSRTERIRAHLDAAPSRDGRFAWLVKTDTFNVFVPILLGAGVLISGLAWLVERVARMTQRGNTNDGLVRQLAALAPPPGGFLGAEDDPLDLLQRPQVR